MPVSCLLLFVLFAQANDSFDPIALPQEYWRAWADEVSVLMRAEEASNFENLVGRDVDERRLFTFVQHFWAQRDPSPGTARNEAREAFGRLATQARLAYPRIGDPRQKAILKLGWPVYRKTFGDCGGLNGSDVQVWHVPGNQRNTCSLPHMDLLFFRRPQADPVSLVFYQRDGICRRLAPGDTLLPGGISNKLLLGRLEREGCFASAPGYRQYLERALADVPTDAEFEAMGQVRDAGHGYADDDVSDPLEGYYALRESARLSLAWIEVVRRAVPVPFNPGTTTKKRHVVASAVLEFDRTAFGEAPAEVPWSTFSVHADLIDLTRGVSKPLAFDTNVFDKADRVRIPFDFEARPGPLIVLVRLTEDSRTVPVSFQVVVPELVDSVAERPPDAPQATLLSAIATAPRIRISEGLDDNPVTGATEVSVSTTGLVSSVDYQIDGETVVTSESPPFSSVIQFDSTPKAVTLTAIARAVDARPLASDQVTLNSGAQRFEIRLNDLSPLRFDEDGGTSVIRPRATVAVPAGRAVETMTFSLDGEAVTTLYEPPWSTTLTLRGRDSVVVEAAVVLDDGRKLESAGVVQPGTLMGVAESMDVDLVEVYASMTKRGRPVPDLERHEVMVKEDGVEQEILEFQRSEDLPISVVLLVDTSTSMAVQGDLVKEAAARFLESVVSEKDRAALVQFDTIPKIVVPLTSDGERLRHAASSLWINGGTAFRDAVVTSLHYLAGGRGRRALVVLTDGIDEHSVLTMNQALAFAQQTGVAVYTIALGSLGNPYAQDARGSNSTFQDRREADRALFALSKGSGGVSFRAGSAEELDGIYSEIEADLRQQYAMSYEAPQGGDGFRRVTVKVKRPGVKVRTATGYYP